MEDYLKDHMNIYYPNLAPVSIKIKSDIKDTVYESFICEKCVHPFRLKRNKCGV